MLNLLLPSFITPHINFRVRLKEAEDEESHRIDMEKRIKTLLSLKNNIESNKVCNLIFNLMFTVLQLTV